MNKPAKRNHRRKPGAAGLRAGLFVMMACVVAGMVVVGSLRWIDPVTSSIILQGNLFGERPYSQRASFDWQPLEKISAAMALAVADIIDGVIRLLL